MDRRLVMACSIVLVTGHWSLVRAPEAYAETADRIVAIVNDDVITEGDVVSHMSALLQQSDPPADGDQAGQMRRTVIRRLIEERLVLQEAKRMDLTVGSEEVANRLRDIKQRLETREAYEQMLREADLSEEQLKLEIQQQLLAQKAVDRKIRATVVVSPAEVAKAMEQISVPAKDAEEIRALHLLIRVNAQRSTEEASALAKQLHERLLKGESFEELARRYSNGPEAEEGGLMGWVRQGHLLPELDRVLFSLRAGQLSDPIQTHLGFHLLKAVERRSLAAADAAQERRRVQQRLYQEKFTRALTEWLDELKRRAYIQILNE